MRGRSGRVLDSENVRYVFLACFIIFIASDICYYALAGNAELIARGFSDDAYYYFEIAHNVASSGRLTFDGLHNTNGFHPLWLANIIPVFLLNLSEVDSLRIIGIYCSLLFGGFLLPAFGEIVVYINVKLSPVIGGKFTRVFPYL